MYSVSHDIQKFECFALTNTSNEYLMPSDRSVVSVDMAGEPVSYFDDAIWDFNAFFNHTREQSSRYQINFHHEKHNPELLKELKQRIYFLIWGDTNEMINMEGAVFRKFESCRVCAQSANYALRLFKGTSINSLTLLNNELVFTELLHDGKKYSEKTVNIRLAALSTLAQLNHHFPKSHHFSLGIPEGKSIRQIAKQYSTNGKGHFPTVVPSIYENLMGRLIEDVTFAHNNILNIKNVKGYAQKNKITERQAFNEFRTIEGACFMALSAFTGMRISELTQIDSTSYKEIDLDGIKLSTLRSWTRKLEKLPREDTWACAPICKKALEVLSVLNDDYRSIKGDIFSSPRFSFDGNHAAGDNISNQLDDAFLNTSNLDVILNNYSRHLNISYIPDEMEDVYRMLNPVVPAKFSPIKTRTDGSFYWHFTTHSLRRTFAHFVVGNGLVTLAALKYQFKHISLSMTAIYASHAEVLTLLGIEQPAKVKKVIEEAEINSHRTYLRDMVEQPESQSGGFMKAFEGQPKAMTEEQFEALVQKTKGASKSTGYGRCFAGFKCKMEHIFDKSNCIGRDCENLNINHDEALRWQRRHKNIAKRIQKMKDMGFYNQNTLARELTDIRAAEKVMIDHNIKFKKFNLGLL